MILWRVQHVAMKLVGDLKEKVGKAETSEEAKEIIKDAGMELTDEEMNEVAGGQYSPLVAQWSKDIFH